MTVGLKFRYSDWCIYNPSIQEASQVCCDYNLHWVKKCVWAKKKLLLSESARLSGIMHKECLPQLQLQGIFSGFLFEISLDLPSLFKISLILWMFSQFFQYCSQKEVELWEWEHFPKIVPATIKIFCFFIFSRCHVFHLLPLPYLPYMILCNGLSF